MEKTCYEDEVIMDLYKCNYNILTSQKKIAECVQKTCGVIKIKPYENPLASNSVHDKNNLGSMVKNNYFNFIFSPSSNNVDFIHLNPN